MALLEVVAAVVEVAVEVEVVEVLVVAVVARSLSSGALISFTSPACAVGSSWASRTRVRESSSYLSRLCLFSLIFVSLSFVIQSSLSLSLLSSIVSLDYFFLLKR